MEAILNTKRRKKDSHVYLSARIPADVRNNLNKASAASGIKKKVIVAEALRRYLPLMGAAQ